LASVVTIAEGDDGLDRVFEGDGARGDDPVQAASVTSAPAISRAVVARA
jgi:hypothetical protein